VCRIFLGLTRKLAKKGAPYVGFGKQELTKRRRHGREGKGGEGGKGGTEETVQQGTLKNPKKTKKNPPKDKKNKKPKKTTKNPTKNPPSWEDNEKKNKNLLSFKNKRS